MKNIVNITIKVFIIFSVFEFISSIISLLINHKAWDNSVKILLPYIIYWCICSVIVIILWIKSKNISDKIVGKNQPEILNMDLGFKEILTIGIVILGIYLIITSLPKLFSRIYFILMISKILYSKDDSGLFANTAYLKQFLIDETVQIIEVLLKIIFAYIAIKKNEIIVKKITDINKNS